MLSMPTSAFRLACQFNEILQLDAPCSKPIGQKRYAEKYTAARLVWLDRSDLELRRTEFWRTSEPTQDSLKNTSSAVLRSIHWRSSLVRKSSRSRTNSIEPA